MYIYIYIYIYMVAFFSVPNCDVITDKKPEDLEYLWLKSKFGITTLGKKVLYYAE